MFGICAVNLLSNSEYGFIAPFLPSKLVDHGVPLYMFGFIFSIYSVSVILCSTIVGYMLNHYKRTKIL